jgi:hypothetical protein
LDSFDRFIHRAAARDRQGVRTRRADPVRRHLAIIDPSRLRRDCLKLALGLQAKRWRVTDVAAPAELARLIAQGLRFAVILFGGPTCRQISLADLDCCWLPLRERRSWSPRIATIASGRWR